MRAITIRFGDSTFAQIKQEAAQEGISMSAFIREAAFARAVLLAVRRGDHDIPEAHGLKAAVEAYLAAEDLRRPPPT